MAKYTISTTSHQDQALSYIMPNQENWVNEVVNNRSAGAVKEIVKIYTERALDEGVQIPTTKEEIVADAFTRGWVKTAKQRNEEAEKNKPE
tara:strand:+ start:650 stop:922 length:273 start_codon:yes stop_codon:yes gene_type:complete